MSNNFVIYGRERVGKEGGDVLVAVSTHLPSEEIQSINTNNIEFLAVYIKLQFKSMFITCSYIPPSSNPEIYIQHANCIKHISKLSKPGDYIIVLGDFNLPNITWFKNPDSCFQIPSSRSESSIEFIDSIADLGLFQINSIPNTFGKLLDLVFVDQPEDFNISRLKPLLTPEDNYHPTLEINLYVEIRPSFNSNNNLMVFDFRKADFSKLNELFLSEKWFDYIPFNCGNPQIIEDNVSHFYKVLYKCFKMAIPMIKKENTHGPPWNTKHLCKLKNIKNKHYKKYTKSGLSTDYMKYSISRSIYNSENVKCYKNYLSKMKETFKSNPKYFYKFVNSKRRVTGYPSLMKFGDKESSEVSAICDMFATFFSSTYSSKSYDEGDYPYPIPEAPLINCPVLDTSSVMRSVQNLKYSYTYGPDGVPSCILMNCLSPLITPLTYLFNLSLSNGYFPED